MTPYCREMTGGETARDDHDPPDCDELMATCAHLDLKLRALHSRLSERAGETLALGQRFNEVSEELGRLEHPVSSVEVDRELLRSEVTQVDVEATAVLAAVERDVRWANDLADELAQVRTGDYLAAELDRQHLVEAVKHARRQLELDLQIISVGRDIANRTRSILADRPTDAAE
ncbi:MAG: hypothetical protein ACRDT8_13970 [Micromonosporaceae bacterium]